MKFWRQRETSEYSNVDRKKDDRAIGSLSIIAENHGINPEYLVNALLRALRNNESKCRKLCIECRQKTDDYAIFLITKKEDVISQFPVTRRMLQKPKKVLVDYVKYEGR